MKRLMAVLSLTLLLVVLIPAVAGASPQRANNQNGTEVVFTCECGAQVTVWVNFVASEAGHSPAIVVGGSDARVFKLVSYEVQGDPTVYLTGFPAPQHREIVTCTHPLTLEDGTVLTVTLHGVFLP
jgi:hypothetical protein